MELWSWSGMATSSSSWPGSWEWLQCHFGIFWRSSEGGSTELHTGMALGAVFLQNELDLNSTALRG